MTDRIAEAQKVLAMPTSVWGSPSEMLARAQVNATLAIVEQLRIGNLIALGYGGDEADCDQARTDARSASAPKTCSSQPRSSQRSATGPAGHTSARWPTGSTGAHGSAGSNNTPKETTLMSKRIDEIRGRLRYRRHLPIYTPSMAAVENKNDLYDWSFRGTYHDALFMAHAVDDIRFLLGEIDRLEAEAEGDADDD